MYLYLGASGLIWIVVGVVALWVAQGALGVVSSVPLVSTLLQVLGLVMVVQIVADTYRGKSWPTLPWPTPATTYTK